MCFWSFSDLINVLLFIDVRDIHPYVGCMKYPDWALGVPRPLPPAPPPQSKTTPLDLTISSFLWEKSEPPFCENFEIQPPSF